MEFRVALAAGGTDPITMETEPLNASDSDEAAIEKMFLSSMRCVEDTMKVLDAKKLARFVDEIVAAHRVAITGLGASGHLAVITAEHLGLLGVDAAATIDEHMNKGARVASQGRRRYAGGFTHRRNQGCKRRD